MKQQKILHISDLHIDENSGSILEKKSYMSAFLESLENQEGLDTMVISGDIVDKGGSQRAYEKAEKIIKNIKEKLNIVNILCVPGNHDVNRDLLKAEEKRLSNPEEKSKLWSHYNTKFELYLEFLENMGLKQGDSYKPVAYVILENAHIILLGLDSTDWIGTEDQCGYINEESLTKSLEEILGDTDKYNEYTKLAVLHHRPIVYSNRFQMHSENGNIVGQYGTCDPGNWERIKNVLLKYDIHYVLTGHVHGTQSEQIRTFETENDAINYSTVGSIGIDFSKEIKEILHKDADKNADLLKKFEELKCYESISGNHNAYNLWTFTRGGLIKEEQFKYIVDEGKFRWVRWSEKIFKKEKDEGITDGIFSTEPEMLPSNTDKTNKLEPCSKELLRCVRENKLYRTGHFHWKNSARLNWIDTSYFFGHRSMMNVIANGIDILFQENERLKKVNCIIGLGIKGSIMLSYVRFLFPEKACSYFPENKHEHNSYELKLFEENNKELKSIAVLTDVVHSGDTIRNFIREVHGRINKKIVFNIVTIIDATADEKISTIEETLEINLFPITRIKVTNCTGGMQDCAIYTEKLAYVYEYKED